VIVVTLFLLRQSDFSGSHGRASDASVDARR
jgi:hypothetical protein